MKKLAIAVLAVIGCSVNLFAYNPPAGGQNYLRLTSPQLLTGASSAGGGALFNVVPSSIINNPALTAWEQRSELAASGTILKSSNSDDEHSVGSAFEFGILIPSRWGVASFVGQGIWSEFLDMYVGDSMNVSAGFSKDITDEVSVGIAFNGGYLFGKAGSDWTASASLGAYYNYGTLGFLKNLRFGAAVTNLGKMYDGSNAYGINDSQTDKMYLFISPAYYYYNKKILNDGKNGTAWPALATLRTGVAASLIDTKYFKTGISLDVAFPGFQNAVVDAGLQMEIADIITLSTSWECDVQELKAGAKNLLPSVGLSCKFTFNSKDGSFLARKGWKQSEMTLSGAWKRMYQNIDAVSAGAVMDLGLADLEPPEIILWGDKK